MGKVNNYTITNVTELQEKILNPHNSRIGPESTIRIKNVEVLKPLLLYNKIYKSNSFASFTDLNVDKKRLHIECPVIFDSCYFESDITIQDICFESTIEFHNCQIGGTLILQRNVFQEEITIDDLNIKQNFIVTDCVINSVLIKAIHVNELTLQSNEIKKITAYDPSVINIFSVGFQKEFEQNFYLNRCRINSFSIVGRNKDGELVLTNTRVNKFLIYEFDNESRIVLTGLCPIGNSADTSFAIVRSQLGKFQSYQLDLSQYDFVTIFDSNLLDSAFISTQWANVISSKAPKGTIDYAMQKAYTKDVKLKLLKKQKETYRQLKFLMEKQGDRLNEVRFYENEMNIHNRLLKWSSPFKDSFWDKIILYASNYFSRYGQSLIRPLIWLFIFNAIFFLVLVLVYDYKGITISFSLNYDSTYFYNALGEYFILLNPTHKMDESLNGWAVFFDLISRVSVGFFFYNAIRATRRFVK